MLIDRQLGIYYSLAPGKAEFLGGEGGVPRCRALCSPVSEKCPVQKTFGMGEMVGLSVSRIMNIAGSEWRQCFR